MTLVLVLILLAGMWLSGYLWGRHVAGRLDDQGRDALWTAAVEHGREVERRVIWTELWTHGQATHIETRPRA